MPIMSHAGRPATRRTLRTITRPQSPHLAQAQIQIQIQTRTFHPCFTPQLEDQTTTLSDGRTIGFAEYGTRTGTPTFFFHGAPGSRYDGFGYSEPAARLGVRLICPDRPGHGLSTAYPGRSLSSYARDISELAAHLGLRRYHVFGQSGGDRTRSRARMRVRRAN